MFQNRLRKRNSKKKTRTSYEDTAQKNGMIFLLYFKMKNYNIR
jgi:hypothetical protein